MTPIPQVCRFGFMALVFAFSIGAQENSGEASVLLRFIHREGEVQHADAQVNESVYVNGVFSHRAGIEESSVTHVQRVHPDGSAVLKSTFRTEERISGSPGLREWISAETVVLTRNAQGRMTVPQDAARPVLRHVPVFPETEVLPRERWTARGEEVHVFRIEDVLYGPYRGDVLASYEYLGREEGKLARIRVEYDMYIPVRGSGEPLRLISGRSVQEILWKIDAGHPVSKTEDFEFLLVMTNGQTQEFRGQQDVLYRVVPPLDREGVADSLRREFRDVPGMSVQSGEDGVRLVLDAAGPILFAPESAVVEGRQQGDLEALSRVLDAHTDRDIVITGHTAHFGTAEGRRRLSLERARSVADILFPEGWRGPGRLYLRGRGSEEPVGRDAENRRVEILIMD